MHRTVAILVAVLLSAGLAGCIGDGTQDATRVEETASTDAGRSLPRDLSIGDGEKVEADGTSVLWRWTGQLPGASPGDVTSQARTTFELPADRRLQIEGTLTWETDQDAVTRRLGVLNVTDADGRERCRGTTGPSITLGGGVEGPDQPVRCSTPIVEPQPQRSAWGLQVTLLSDPQPTAFTVELELALLPASELMGPAIPEGGVQEGPGLVLDEPVTVDPRIPAHEPSISVAPEGTIWVTGYVDQPGLLWRSTDDGRSFERVSIPGPTYCNLHQNPPQPPILTTDARTPPGIPEDERVTHPGCGDTDVVSGPQGTVYFTQHWGGESVHASHDGGETWTSFLPASNEIAATDRQWITTDGDQRAWMVYNSVTRVPFRQVTGDDANTITRTTDGGQTWRVVGQIQENEVPPGEIAYSQSDGMLYVSGATEAGPGVAVSGDDGESWSWSTVADRSGDDGDRFCYVCGILVPVDTDQAGNVYVAWTDPSDGPGLDVWMASSTDGGSSWSAPVKVNHGEGTHVMPWIAAGPEGTVAVAWYGTRDTSGAAQACCDWYLHLAMTDQATAPDPAFSEVVASEGPVQRGPVCLGGAGCGDARNLGDLLEITLDEDGDPHVAYTDGRSGGGWNQLSRVMYVGGSLDGPSS